MEIKVRVEQNKPNINLQLKDNIVVYRESGREPQEKEVEYIENGEYLVTPDDGYILEEVKVKVDVPIPEGNIDITNTEEYDVTKYATAQIKDDNLKPENIAEGVEVLGIEGTFRGGIDTSDATATSDDLLKGKTAYANEKKLVGTIEDYDYSTSENVGVEYTDAFYKLVNGTLTEIDDDRITNLKNYAFYYDNSIESIRLENLSSLNTAVFGACKALKRLDLPNLKNVYGGSSIANCDSLEYLNVPSLQSASASSIIANAISLKEVSFPALTTCGGSFLGGCTSLEKIEFGNIMIINATAFQNCSSLKKVIIRTTSKVCELRNTNAFSGTGIANGTGYIYVRDNLLDQYKSATNWSTYASQIKPLSELEVE